MPGWVSVLIAAGGFLVAVITLGFTIVKPIISLTKSITTLTVEVNGLRTDLAEQKKDTHESFVKVWNHEDKQDDAIDDHEKRIYMLEHR